ncbi:MAG: 4-hydroxy-tetrahydrodipicolinate synthase [Candidatus Deianiraeaceae bacterium]|jgi:4-hydroxy-tetrahydrodipicolinate synthase
MITGVHTAIIMPFSSGKIDYDKLDQILTFQNNNGIDGIVLHGTTGESPTIMHEEFIESTNYVVKNWAERLHITVGVSNNSTDVVLKNCDRLTLQPHAFLVTPPSYSKPTQEGVFQHFKAIAQNTQVPIIAYNVPARTASDILPDTLLRMADELPNIVAIKDATSSFARLAQEQYLLRNIKRDFSLLTGDDITALHFLLSGGNGIISVVSNIVPAIVLKMLNLSSHGSNVKEAYDVYFQIYNLINLLFIESNPMPVKYAMYRMGLCKLEYRLPMCDPSKELMYNIDKELERLHLI